MNVGYRWIGALVVGSCVLLESQGLLAAPAPLHAFEFEGGFANSGVSNIAIQSEGGALIDGAYSFDPQLPPGDWNQGLTLQSPGLGNPGVWSIEMRLNIDLFRSLSNERWMKLIDIENGAVDRGVYVEDAGGGAGNGQQGLLTYVWGPQGGPPGVVKSGPVLAAGEWAHLAITRAGSGEVRGYVDGAQVYQVANDQGYGIFDGPNNVMRFFQVDQFTLDTYNSYDITAGAVDFLRIYDETLAPADVAELAAAAVPEASAIALAATAVALLSGRRRHWR